MRARKASKVYAEAAFFQSVAKRIRKSLSHAQLQAGQA
jgi:hypothetical protein